MLPADDEWGAAHSVMVSRWRAAVVSATDADTEYGWLTVAGIRWPRRSVICCLLRRQGLGFLVPRYKWPQSVRPGGSLSPVGMKQPEDCAHHTDAWLGAGLSLAVAYDEDHPAQDSFAAALSLVAKEVLSAPVLDVLCRGVQKSCVLRGEVCTDPQRVFPGCILVVERAQPEWVPAMLRSKAVICAQGSKVAHLVVVAREQGVPIVRSDAFVGKVLEACGKGMRVEAVIDFLNATLEFDVLGGVGLESELERRLRRC